MEFTELYAPQIEVCVGAYTFCQGVQIEVSSAQSSYFDWGKIKFTEAYQPEITLNPQDTACIRLGYGDSLQEVFRGYVAASYNGSTATNEILLKDEMLRLESTVVCNTFLDTTPQEILTFLLASAGFSKWCLSSKVYPVRRMLPIRNQNAIQAIQTIHAAWGIKVPFFCADGVFYWDERPKQEKVYTFEYGVNILSLQRRGGVWELATVSAPFIRHSQQIQVVHPRFCGEAEVSKVIFRTTEEGFIRTYLYF